MDFTEPWKDSDLVLAVEGKRLHVHRLILAFHSPVFDSMLNSDFKEKNSSEIPLPGKSAEEIEEMLEVIYDRSKEITDSNVQFLIALADEYQMLKLRSECIKFMKHADKTGLNALKFINIVHKYNIKCMEDTCIENIKLMCSKEITESEEFQQLDDDTKFLIAISRTNHIEEKLSNYESSLNCLLSYLYRAANNTYTEDLRNKGYEESILSYCQNKSNHANKKVGEKFDVTCGSCRQRMKMTKDFNVRTKDVCELMEELFLLKEKR